MKKIHHFKDYSVVDGRLRFELDMSRFEDQYNRAQFKLDSAVMTSMVPFMPMQTGTFINVTRAMSASMAGSGRVMAAAPPHGRFLYKGLTMVDELTGSPWARAGSEKVLVSQFGGATAAREELVFSKGAHPQAQAEWFEPAKKRDKNMWLSLVKSTAGGGNNG